jgi:hypothetical protein
LTVRKLLQRTLWPARVIPHLFLLVNCLATQVKVAGRPSFGEASAHCFRACAHHRNMQSLSQENVTISRELSIGICHGHAHMPVGPVHMTGRRKEKRDVCWCVAKGVAALQAPGVRTTAVALCWVPGANFHRIIEVGHVVARYRLHHLCTCDILG